MGRRAKLWRNQPAFFFGGLLVLFLLAAAAFGPELIGTAWEDADAARALAPPGAGMWFGADSLGRDLFARTVYGLRVSMIVALVTSAAALTFGTAYGAISGYSGERLDGLMMRIVDVVYSFPSLLLVILVTVVRGERDLFGIVLALALVSWVSIARLIRGEVLSLRESEYVEGARALGVRTPSILWRHILPNTFGPLIVTLTFRIPSIILAESALSFIGLGLQPPLASLGSLAAEGWTAMRFQPHLIVFPSVVLVTVMLGFNLFGDGLRDYLDPKSLRPLK